jgi:hypothetical protein
LESKTMTTRKAACNCGQLHLTCEGAPARISMCHCLECQRRTGSSLGVQARFPRSQVSRIEGKATQYIRVADSGNPITFYFCPVCGSTVYWELKSQPDLIAVAVGAFADPDFPPPEISVWEKRRHAWAELSDKIPLKRNQAQ